MPRPIHRKPASNFFATSYVFTFLGQDGMLRVEVKMLIGESLIGEPGGTWTRKSY